MNDNAPEEKFPTSGRTIKGANQIEDLDERAMARAETLADLGWPEETNPTRLVVPAGSIGITHFDVYHRGERQILLLLPCRVLLDSALLRACSCAGTHRFAGPDMDKRIMIKLWYHRAADNAPPSWNHTPADDDDAPLAFRTDALLCWQRCRTEFVQLVDEPRTRAHFDVFFGRRTAFTVKFWKPPSAPVRSAAIVREVVQLCAFLTQVARRLGVGTPSDIARAPAARTL